MYDLTGAWSFQLLGGFDSSWVIMHVKILSFKLLILHLYRAFVTLSMNKLLIGLRFVILLVTDFHACRYSDMFKKQIQTEF